MVSSMVYACGTTESIRNLGRYCSILLPSQHSSEHLREEVEGLVLELCNVVQLLSIQKQVFRRASLTKERTGLRADFPVQLEEFCSIDFE